MADSYSDEARHLVLGKGVTVGAGTRFSGGRIVIGDGSRIGQGVDITVTEELVFGKGTRIGDYSIIRGRRIHAGREFYMNHHAEIGGGSCFEPASRLDVGYWFHLGSCAVINTARAVTIGNEVGLGRMSNVYTHGAYLSEIDGFPVKFARVRIGSRVWIPSATVNPGVTIGDDVVIGVGSLVTHDIPSGALAMGVPCKVVKEKAYPKPLARAEAVNAVRRILAAGGIRTEASAQSWRVKVQSAAFDLRARTVSGVADERTERARELLRRHGVRFMVDVVDGRYEKW